MDNISKRYAKKTLNDKIVKGVLLGITMMCAMVIIFVIIFIFIKGMKPFISHYTIDGIEYAPVNFWKFLTGNAWETGPNEFGIGYVIINTVYVVILAIVIAIPISILTALFISKIAPKIIGKSICYVIEILASVPSIIFGIFGKGQITKMVKEMALFFGYQSAGGISVLSSALVLAIMIIPTITLIATTSINAVKKDLVQASLALGATQTQTNFKVVLISAKSGIFAGIILGVGRALGEATAISMVAGNAGSGPNLNIFGLTRTLTTTMLMGFSETSGLKYDIRFSVGIVLIFIIIGTNLGLNFIKRKLQK